MNKKQNKNGGKQIKKDHYIEVSVETTVQWKKELIRRNFVEFAKFVDRDLEMTIFHDTYYQLLNKFACGEIKKLIVSVPPQHGKSHGASKLLPAYLLGIDPDLKITIASYSFSLARKFGQGVQQLIAEPSYRELFPNTLLKGMAKSDTAIRAADEFDIVGKNGGLRLVGRESSLTGNRVDVIILDDLYKDAMEANSSVIRQNVWEWYTSVVKTRMHNNSRELIVFTRWHEEDLIGKIAENELIYDIKSLKDLSQIPSRSWVRVNFEAIKESPSTDLDPRQIGEVLWPERHSLELLNEKKMVDEKVFDALYQGRPSSKEGLLYDQFKTYSKIDSPTIKVANYTDTADTGSDYLCSICYCYCEDGCIYVLDLVYTKSSMEVTEGAVAKMLIDNKIESCVVESNNGGRGFSRAVARMIYGKCKTKIFTHAQRKNKEARIISNATSVSRMVIMPNDWNVKWKLFAKDLQSFKREFTANDHDDAADALTAIVELETTSENKIESVIFKTNNI